MTEQYKPKSPDLGGRRVRKKRDLPKAPDPMDRRLVPVEEILTPPEIQIINRVIEEDLRTIWPERYSGNQMKRDPLDPLNSDPTTG